LTPFEFTSFEDTPFEDTPLEELFENSAMTSSKTSKQYDAVSHAGDPQVSNLKTPINSSALAMTFINGLPIYRPGLPITKRGLEVGMAHGYWMVGPFLKLGPLRGTAAGGVAALLSTVALLAIATAALYLYSMTNPPAPLASVTVATPPKELSTPKGWQEFAKSFFVGGAGGALVGFLIASVLGIFGG
jgi:photosystem I subunit XI